MVQCLVRRVVRGLGRAFLYLSIYIYRKLVPGAGGARRGHLGEIRARWWPCVVCSGGLLSTFDLHEFFCVL